MLAGKRALIWGQLHRHSAFTQECGCNKPKGPKGNKFIWVHTPLHNQAIPQLALWEKDMLEELIILI